MSSCFPQAPVLQQGDHESPQVERTTPVQQESKHLIWVMMSMLMCLDSYVRTVTPRGSTDCIDTDAATSVDGGPMQNAHTTNFGPKGIGSLYQLEYKMPKPDGNSRKKYLILI
nr:hypothetical protein [Tanacetum cinerariifolium]